MSSSWPDDLLDEERNTGAAVSVFECSGFPPPTHPAEADLFSRQYGVPGHNQDALSGARILVVGAGGLGSWTALALARSGARTMTIIDHDVFDRTNAPRQLMFGADLGQPKAVALARNLSGHLLAGGQLIAVSRPFLEAVENFALPADIALFLVDNNRCRFDGIRFARHRRIPAVFTMLSADGLRMHSFLQGPNADDACLHCALPNLDASTSAPCASATIASCHLAAAFTTFFAYRALMGWPPGVESFNWREADLMSGAPDRVGMIIRRPDCPRCIP